MEQRPLRLGDIVDDYCSRERRITNHAIVAIVEDSIRQTRCTTCDAEHPFRGAKEPRLRKKGSGTELDHQVLADVNGNGASGHVAEEALAASASDPDALDGEESSSDSQPEMADQGHDLWPGHRRLIRATLPRSENEPPPPRPIPEFTMHQKPPARAGRGFRFRGGQPAGNGHAGGPGQGRPPRPGRHREKKRPR